MPLKINQIKKFVDKDHQSGYDTRLKASDDRVFYFITQWDDQTLRDSQLGYRGEFNILKKAGRQIISELAENPVQVDFLPLDETRDDSAELLDGLYRADDNNNITIEAYENGKLDAVVCGVGAWEMYTEYKSLSSAIKHQVIKRRPIFEAVNCVYWDANSRLLDKSDAKRVSILVPYSKDGFLDYASELTGEDPEDIEASSFKQPEESYAFPWFGTGEGEKVYIVTFYHREKIKTKLLTMVDPLGESKDLLESQLAPIMDEMIEEGWKEESSKNIEAWEVRKYIASGKEILNGEMVDGERSGEVIAGENIPVIPIYGEHTVVEGEEHYEGVTRLTKDPQRLRNFAMSYVADIVSRSPRNKPIYAQEQIAGFEDMYSETGNDDNYPYRLQRLRDSFGNALPLGPLGETPEQKMPSSLIALIGLTRESVEDVANPGLPQDVADPDMSGKAIYAIQARIDQQSTIYQNHFKHAKRRDAEIYASMAKHIYDVPRKVMLTMPDGTRKDSEIMQTVLDKETGEMVVINDLNNAEFEVYSKIGPSYTSQKEQSIERMSMMMQGMDPGDPIRRILQLKILATMDGVEFDDIRKHTRKELIVQGVMEPDTPEEMKLLEDAKNKPQEPDAATLLAMAEMKKGDAALQKNQIEVMKVQANTRNEDMKRLVDKFEAATDRMNTQIDAQEAGANINYKRVDAMGVELDNAAKAKTLKQLDTISFADMSDDALVNELLGTTVAA